MWKEVVVGDSDILKMFLACLIKILDGFSLLVRLFGKGISTGYIT
jgi:hypothetical protein